MRRIDPAHYYFDDMGRPWPSVTQILQQTGFYSGRFYTAAASGRGTKVHQWIEDYENWRDAVIYPEIKGYCEAYQRFCEDEEFICTGSEKIVYDELYRYAGAYDLKGYTKSYGLVLLDAKTGRPERWHSLQVGAYDHADGGESDMAGMLYLKDNGTYKIEMALSSEVDVFLSAAAVWWWQVNNKSRRWEPPAADELLSAGNHYKGE